MGRGYQVTFFTQHGRMHGDKHLAEWLLETLETMGIHGATMMVCQEGLGHDHQFHTYHFLSAQDQPIEVAMVVSEADCMRLFERLDNEEGLALFYAKTPVEFGTAGGGNR
ncbi:hypothetical protein AU476_14985 [Cupriavidus sp. UYMSc13B]|nr:hypothetical protein AU476_14985 [Cupriavidus sp. UYMSc13B]